VGRLDGMNDDRFYHNWYNDNFMMKLGGLAVKLFLCGKFRVENNLT